MLTENKPIPTFDEIMFEAADRVGAIKGFEYFPSLAIDIVTNKRGSDLHQMLLAMHPFALEAMKLLLKEVLQLAAERATVKERIPYDIENLYFEVNKQSILDLEKLFL